MGHQLSVRRDQGRRFFPAEIVERWVQTSPKILRQDHGVLEAISGGNTQGAVDHDQGPPLRFLGSGTRPPRAHCGASP